MNGVFEDAVSVFQSVVVCCVSKGSRRSDEEALEEQVRKLGEELRDLREMYEAGQDKSHSREEEVLQLHNQVRTANCVHASASYMSDTALTRHRPHGRPSDSAAVCGDVLSPGRQRADEDDGGNPRTQRAAPERNQRQRRGHRQVR